MIKNVAILIFDGAEVLDFAGPFEVFSVSSQINEHKVFDVFTVSKKNVIISALNNLLVKPNYCFQDHPRIDILILAGGWGTGKLLEDKEVMDWVRNIHAGVQFTLSICSASRVLATLGLLDGKPYCTHHEVYDNMESISPTAIPNKDKRFVQSDEKIYTSGGISAGIDLSFHIVEKLIGKEAAVNTAEYMEYNINFSN